MKNVALGEVVEDLTEERKIIISDDEEIIEPTIKSKTHSMAPRNLCLGSELKIKKRVLIKEGDLVFSKLHTQNGSFAFADQEYKSTTTFLPLKILENKMIKDFLFYQLHLVVPKLQVSDTVGRETYKTKDILGIEIILPSIEEQKEILNKIQSIENEIKQLENNVSYDENLLSKLRQAILHEAVQGKLVPQNPKDEPASELLKKIRAEKEKLIKEGKIRKQKELPAISEDEVPYDLPKGWVWCRLGDVCDVRDGTHDTPKYVKEGIPLVTSKNIYNGKLNLENVKFISEEDHTKISYRSKVDIDDILFAMIGSIGNPVLIEEEPNFSIKNVALFKDYNSNLSNKKYLLYFLQLAQLQMNSNSSGAVQSFVPLNFLRNYLIPLPPLPEQRRIVEKVDALMRFCDDLELRIKENKINSESLIGSVLREAFRE